MMSPMDIDNVQEFQIVAHLSVTDTTMMISDRSNLILYGDFCHAIM